ncbi:MAG TPA: cysteine peptidase family C39 domain-containing protein [Candidatus Elarobacter sp.]|nr:cysteine peptidase family C39 domain-containing protein [Candidatus Elarobacter sp.]
MLNARRSAPHLAVLALVALVAVAASAAWARLAAPPAVADARLLRRDAATPLAPVAGMVMQRGSSDCGPATLRNFALVTHRAALGAQLARDVPFDLGGATVGDMQAALRRGGISTTAETRRDLDLHSAQLPAIVLVHQHYLVALRRTAGRLDVLDPWLGHVGLDVAHYRGRQIILIRERST